MAEQTTDQPSKKQNEAVKFELNNQRLRNEVKVVINQLRALDNQNSAKEVQVQN